jgi:hypothetical protein
VQWDQYWLGSMPLLSTQYIETTIADNKTAAGGLSKQQPAVRTQDHEIRIYIFIFLTYNLKKHKGIALPSTEDSSSTNI